MKPNLKPSNTPLTQGPSEEDRLAWLRLIRSRRVNAGNVHRLVAEYGTPQLALLALPKIAAQAGVTDYTPCPEGVARAELKLGASLGLRLVGFSDADYPPALRSLTDAPPLLWVKGDTSLPQRPTLALVGARNASSLGLRMTTRLARELGEAGFTIISGLARGVDAAAHTAALDSGTIGVTAGGVDVVYPQENSSLYKQVGEKGLIVSEQPPSQSPQTWHFPLRNRLISGMAQAVIVIEAAEKSGSLLTARDALDQGREVLAVPGHPVDARAGGTNLLIREGATLVRSAEDVIEALGRPEVRPALRPAPPPEAPKKSKRPLERGKQEIRALHQMILDRLGQSPTSEDQLSAELAQNAKSVKAELVSLELEGQIDRDSGGWLRIRH